MLEGLDLLRGAVLEDLEVLAFQIHHRLAVAERIGVDADEVRLDAETRRLLGVFLIGGLLRRLLGAERGGHKRKHTRGDEAAGRAVKHGRAPVEGGGWLARRVLTLIGFRLTPADDAAGCRRS